MSLFLYWENPLELCNIVYNRARIHRRFLDSDQTSVIADDVVWGFFEDEETSNPNHGYRVEYYDARCEENQFFIEDCDIKRYPEQGRHCVCTWDLVAPDGCPDAGRGIQFSDDLSGGNFQRRILTNANGLAAYTFKRGSVVRIKIDLELHALEVAVPDQSRITYDELLKLGNIVEADNRGWY